MTETRFYEPAKLSALTKPLFSLKNRWTPTWLRSLLSKVFLFLNLRKPEISKWFKRPATVMIQKLPGKEKKLFS